MNCDKKARPSTIKEKGTRKVMPVTRSNQTLLVLCLYLHLNSIQPAQALSLKVVETEVYGILLPTCKRDGLNAFCLNYFISFALKGEKISD